jgi:hypothetical protein
LSGIRIICSTQSPQMISDGFDSDIFIVPFL